MKQRDYLQGFEPAGTVIFKLRCMADLASAVPDYLGDDAVKIANRNVQIYDSLPDHLKQAVEAGMPLFDASWAAHKLEFQTVPTT